MFENIYGSAISSIQQCAYNEQLLAPPQRSLTAGEQALFTEF
jgi:hypothetical protein